MPLCDVKTACVVSSYYSTRLVRSVVKAKLEKDIAKKSSTKAKALLQGFITMNNWLRPIRFVLLFDGLYSIYDK